MNKPFVPSRGTCEELTELVLNKGSVTLNYLADVAYEVCVSWSVDENKQQQMSRSHRMEWARGHAQYLSRGENRKFGFDGKVLKVV